MVDMIATEYEAKCSALIVVGSYASNAETAIVSIECLYRQRLLRIEDLTVRDTRVLELCYRTQGVAGLTSSTSYQESALVD